MSLLRQYTPLFILREYLATFKKTVAMHEVFLQRLASHPSLRNDVNYEVFLEFSGDVSLCGYMIACLLSVLFIQVRMSSPTIWLG